MNSQIGIDTLHLNPVEYDLDSHFSAKVKTADFESGTGESSGNYPLYQVAGNTFVGSGAYLSLDTCQLDFTPYIDLKTGTVHVSTKVALTAPKVVQGDNYETADREQTELALKKVEAELREVGFRFDIKDSLVKRCDIARTLQNSDEWASYRPALDVLKPSRMKEVGFETGQRWGNSRRQICLYDKVEEMASRLPKKKRHEVFSQYPQNSMRAELRLTMRDSFQATTQMKTAADLVSDFAHIRAVYRSEFENKLFKHKAPEVEKMVSEALTVETLVAEMTPFIVAGGRWFEEWRKADWVSNRVRDAQRLAVIKSAIREVSRQNGLAKQNIAKQLANLDALFLTYGNVEQSSRTVAELYSELKTGVLSD